MRARGSALALLAVLLACCVSTGTASRSLRAARKGRHKPAEQLYDAGPAPIPTETVLVKCACPGGCSMLAEFILAVDRPRNKYTCHANDPVVIGEFCRTSNQMVDGKTWKFEVDSRHLLSLNGVAFDPAEASGFTVDGRAIPCHSL
ncbi:leucine-rich repeat-containing [Chlorella sorokiniana]|jgi:hypothetical protein|uniref:Leucine-rich repeat-containing n=1 Tax=Chlorella sorokiniana TaxID=3076 RepID=A0A2P6TNF3_CHLSO|nr:leucine-rich repeat-containing [Chlorella sorokiniana]|eukprot:PRW50865.1 leucine-rich repeat-containing [Chlorella sorokiniana]